MSKAIAELLANYQLPFLVDNQNGEDFTHYFNSYIAEYIEAAEKNLDPDVIANTGSKTGILTKTQLDTVKLIADYFTLILDKYMNGDPAMAFFLFDKMIDETGLAKEFLKLGMIKIDKKKYFFRTQKNHDKIQPVEGTYSWSCTITAKDLFHAPFNKRKRVGTNRFSIPGYPCLYLSEDLHTSYLECTQESFFPLDAMCLQNNRPLYIADITPISNEVIEAGKREEGGFGLTNKLLTYYKLFPLIAACHTKIKYEEAYTNEVRFKMEYIIPQLLLQWFQKYSTYPIDGIKYMSCTSASNGHSDTCFNYILTTKYTPGEVFCPKLSALFVASDVLLIGNPDPGISKEIWLKDIEQMLHASSKRNLFDLLKL